MAKGTARLLVVTALAAACAKNPATGERQLTLIPRGQEIEIGREAAEEVAQSVGLYEDQRLQKYVADIGARLAAVSERPNLPWTFRLLDDAAVNAFALPGGYIFVTRGLVAHLNNEAQLASVIGHEIGHVTGKHAINRISKAQLAQLGLGVGMLISEEVRRFGQIGMVGLNLLFLKFSRDDENEADTLGLRYALRSGYDVREMPEVFTTLKRVSEQAQQGRLPEWLSTHPDPERRAERIEARIAQLDLTGTRMMIDTEEYLRFLDGMEFGPNPRHGFFQGDRFLHPDLKFVVTMPAGWRKANLRQAVIAVSPQQDAAMQLTLTDAPSPEAALRAFFAQQGVEFVAPAANVVPGIPSASARFAARTEEGPLTGLVTFVRHQGRTMQILSYAAAPRWPAYANVAGQAHGSFGTLSDPRALAVQPARLAIERAPRAATLEELYRERPASVSLETLALLNQLEPGARVAAGQPLKWVRGGLQAGPVSWR